MQATVQPLGTSFAPASKSPGVTQRRRRVKRPRVVTRHRHEHGQARIVRCCRERDALTIFNRWLDERPAAAVKKEANRQLICSRRLLTLSVLGQPRDGKRRRLREGPGAVCAHGRGKDSEKEGKGLFVSACVVDARELADLSRELRGRRLGPEIVETFY